MRVYTVATRSNDKFIIEAEEVMQSEGTVLFIGSDDENIALFPLHEVLSVTSVWKEEAE